jgi:hypothetical protein
MNISPQQAQNKHQTLHSFGIFPDLSSFLGLAVLVPSLEVADKCCDTLRIAQAYVDFLKAPMFTVGGLPVPGVSCLSKPVCTRLCSLHHFVGSCGPEASGI